MATFLPRKSVGTGQVEGRIMIYLGADHGGYELKKKVMAWLKEWKYKYEDLGPTKLDPQDHYPEFAFEVAKRVSSEDDIEQPWNKRAKGILICRSAGGMMIAANKYPRVRAVAAYDVKGALHCREHNDANVIGLSGDWTSEKEAKEMLKIWLETEFSREDRHALRINQIVARENDLYCLCGSKGEGHDHGHEGHEHGSCDCGGGCC